MGADAAQDDDHIERVFNAIQANWPKRKAPYKVIDMP